VTDADAVVTTEHLSRWYGQVSALNDVTVRVPRGITALLGPNGAGKSTLLRLVTGQSRPSGGCVRVLGEPVIGNPGIYRRIGWCPEHDGFYESMTGLEWVSALLALQGWAAADVSTAAARALAAVGLDEVAGRRIATYSRGMRQRVKLAQAIAHEPELLVLDEPLAGLDPVSRRQAMIEAHPHRVRVRAGDPRGLAQALLAGQGVLGIRLEDGGLTVETSAPDALYDTVTALAADGAFGGIREVSSPDDNLQAVFNYLVKA
jgi:ABC-2 type transport system ATP-binding protein